MKFINKFPLNKKNILTLVKYAGIFLIFIILLFFSVRNFLLHKALDKVSRKFKIEYHCNFQFTDASFKGISGIEIQNISIVPDNKDTLVRIEKFDCSVRLLHAIFLDFRLKEIYVENGFINFVKNKNERNFESFIHRLKKDSTENKIETQEKNYAKIAFNLITKIASKLPAEVLVKQLQFKIDDDGRKVSFNLNLLELKNDILTSDSRIHSETIDQRWLINGNASPKNKTADLKFYNAGGGKILMPYVDERFLFVAGFDSLQFNIESVKMQNDELEILWKSSVSGLLVNHPKISSKDVAIEHSEFDAKILVGENYFSLDSISSFTFNKIKIHPFIKFQNKPDTVYSLIVKIEKTNAQDFIQSLPNGLFTHFKGMETEGSFSYSLDFSYDVNHADEMKFDVNLKKENFRIIKFGEANLSKLNGDFIYVPLEKGKQMRSINVSGENPYFTPLEKMSPYLQKCVLTSEDPSFFQHHGFIEEAFRQSIIKDIQTRKFARGASTISMQLVKNVFLTREKTVSRKLEEILLVYILENNHLVSKERMFEVYFNIIEWGPDVYGIGEASQFYFKKKPAALTLNECLFLTSIIPRPKGFMWRFDKEGNERDFSIEQKIFLGNLMLRRNLILPNDTSGLNHQVKITGAARNLILKTEVMNLDSIIIEENILNNED